MSMADIQAALAELPEQQRGTVAAWLGVRAVPRDASGAVWQRFGQINLERPQATVVAAAR